MARAIRLGPMFTPLARRRPVKVARETATLDVLSSGRLTLGGVSATSRRGTSTRSPGKSSMSAAAHVCSRPSKS